MNKTSFGQQNQAGRGNKKNRSLKRSRQQTFRVEQLESRAMMAVASGYWNTENYSSSTLSGEVGLPLVESLPNAPTDIYLDFVGRGTLKNWEGTGIDYDIEAYDRDGKGNSFDSVERDEIMRIWRDTANYFARFNINVTTIWHIDRPKAIVSIGRNTPSTGDFGAVLGKAFSGNDSYAYVNQNRANFDPPAVAHQVGHLLGLKDQADYDRGILIRQHSQRIDRFYRPIMGDHYEYVGTWSFGTSYSGDTGGTQHPQTQDDYVVISEAIGKYGKPFRADDFGSQISLGAPSLYQDPSSGRQYRYGMIELHDDADTFQFLASGKEMIIETNPDYNSSIKLKTEVLDSNGKLLAALESISPWVNNQSLLIALPKGTYFMRVKGTNNYGDVGTYKVSIRDTGYGPHYTPPTAPLGKPSVTYKYLGDNKASYTWTGVSGATGYVISTSVDGIWFKERWIVSKSTREFIVNSAGSIRSWVKVAAIDKNGVAGPTSVVKSLVDAPERPENVKAFTLPGKGTVITWNDGPGETVYSLEYREEFSTTWQAVNVRTNRPYYHHATEKFHYYRVRALNATGYSSYSSLAYDQYAPIGAAAGLTSTNLSPTNQLLASPTVATKDSNSTSNRLTSRIQKEPATALTSNAISNVAATAGNPQLDIGSRSGDPRPSASKLAKAKAVKEVGQNRLAGLNAFEDRLAGVDAFFATLG